MFSNRKRTKRGFTLVELLVVIAIIGVLVALLLPAVQAAREAARRAQCANNFRQVGVALHNHHNSHQSFPVGMVLSRASCPGYMEQYGGSFVGFGWSGYILPYLEETALEDQIDYSKQCLSPASSGPTSLRNFQLVATQINTYLCPSDSNGGVLVNYTNGGQNGPNPEEDLRSSNMAGVSDSVDWTCDTLRPKRFDDVDGIMGAQKACSITKITDGTSNTLIVGEVTGDVPEHFSGFYWATYNLMDTREGINGPNTLPGGVYASNPGIGIIGFREAGLSSWHPGGCHVLFADSSVHFFSENIASRTLSALTTRSRGEVVPDDFQP